VRILEAAERIFAHGGEAASTEEVARQAHVGIATVFRHFPTKAALLEAVLTQRYERLRRQAEHLAQADAPGQAFFDFFRHMVIDAPSKIALIDALSNAGGSAQGSLKQASASLERAVGALLKRAQSAGAVRSDVDLSEVYVLLIGASRAAATNNFDQAAQARALEIVFRGLAPN
jgi:AcrR family transcriptional regulator